MVVVVVVMLRGCGLHAGALAVTALPHAPCAPPTFDTPHAPAAFRPAGARGRRLLHGESFPRRAAIGAAGVGCS